MEIDRRHPVHTRHLSWTLVALAATLAPHTVHLPAWITIFVIVAGLWRLAAAQRRWPLPPAFARLVLALVGFFSVYVTYGTINGIDAGTALLTLMMSMKLTETRTVRDHVVLLFIGYFLIIASFLYSQTVWSAAWAVPSVWLTTVALLQTTHPGRGIAAPQALRITTALLVQAVPVMLVMFVLFPRVPGPFWALPSQGGSGSTGLSEEMTPGSISELIKSEEVAFRVSFDGEPPPRRDLYWRGPVLHQFDGRSWTKGLSSRPEAVRIEPLGDPIAYEVTLEPHQRDWMFALEMPDLKASNVRDAYLTVDYQPLFINRVTQRKRYSLVSYVEHAATSITPLVYRLNLALPQDSNRRAQALAAGWRAEGLTETEVVNRALRMFNVEEFVYSLRPPVLDQRNPVDDFLFNTQRGFCEHFSSAFTVLMRAAGIPARIVTGYLGGELNPLSGHMTVRQSDAHAWAEVWVGDRGWVRVDPTGAVAPHRIELGLADALTEEELRTTFPFRGLPMLGQLRFGWDALNNKWNDWILGYGQEKQREFLSRLGLKDPSAVKMSLLLVGILLLIGLGLSLYLTWRNRIRATDLVSRLYDRYCSKLSRRALPRASFEGPHDFALRAAEERPELAAEIRAITALYVRLRYLPSHRDEDVARLGRLVRTFRP